MLTPDARRQSERGQEPSTFRAADGYRLDGPLPPLAVPATLHYSLMARLNRMAPVKEISQIGAAIGREFSYSLMR